MNAVRSSTLPALALTLNAFVWGCSWWPLRYLQSNGVHPLWATALIYGTAAIVILLVRPRSLAQPPDPARVSSEPLASCAVDGSRRDDRCGSCGSS